MEEPTFPGVRTMKHEELVATYLRVQAKAREMLAFKLAQSIGDIYFCGALLEEIKMRKASGKLPRSVTDYHVARLPASASTSVKTYYILRLSKPALDYATITTSTTEHNKAMAERASAYLVALYVARADFDVADALGLPLDESRLDTTTIGCIGEDMDEMNYYVEAVKWEEVYRKRQSTISSSSKGKSGSTVVSEPTHIYPSHPDEYLHTATLELGTEHCGPGWCTLWSCVDSSPTGNSARLSPFSYKAQWHMYISAVRDLESYSMMGTARGRSKFFYKDIPIGSGSSCVCGGDLMMPLDTITEVLENPSLNSKTKAKLLAMRKYLTQRLQKTLGTVKIKKPANAATASPLPDINDRSKHFESVCKILENPSLDRNINVTMLATKDSLVQRLQMASKMHGTPFPQDINKRLSIVFEILASPYANADLKARMNAQKDSLIQQLHSAIKKECSTAASTSAADVEVTKKGAQS